MSSFLLIWSLVATVLILLVFCRCTVAFYFLAIVPLTVLILFLVLRHYPNDGSHKEFFFNNFTVGGHRGSPHQAPENSLAALHKACQEGCQLVEFDIQLSKDGVAVLMHDETTGRTAHTNINISTSHSEELIRVELKTVNGVNGSKIPTLTEAVDWCLSHKVKMIFDVKDADTKLISDIARMFSEKGLYEWAVVSSFNPFVPYVLKWHDNRILTGFTSRRSYYSMESELGVVPRGSVFQWALEALDTMVHLGIETMIYPRFLGVDMLLMNHRDISLEMISQFNRQFGVRIVAWTVNNPEEMAWFRDVARIPFLTDEPYKLK